MYALVRYSHDNPTVPLHIINITRWVPHIDDNDSVESIKDGHRVSVGVSDEEAEGLLRVFQ